MNILLTSVGRRSYMVNYFKEALDGKGLIHAANSMETYSMKIADKSVITPLIYDSTFIDFLFDYCKKNNINAIVSLFDIDLLVLSKHKKQFESEGIRIIVSDYKFVQVCNDKWLSYNFLKEYGFNVPLSFLTIKNTLLSLKNRTLKFPLIIKPRWGMGSIGIFEAENENEIAVLYNKTLNSIKKSYLYYESQQDLDKSVIIQEKLNGEEYGLDILNDLNGNYLACVPKKKLAMRAGETDSAEIIKNDDLENIGQSLSKITKHIGNLDVDCFYFDGKFYVLEMNCRFGGQYPFSHLAGVNFPKAIIRMLSGEKIENNLITYKAGTIGIKNLVPTKLLEKE